MSDHVPLPPPPAPGQPDQTPAPVPAPVPADAAPADLAPPPGRRERLAWYAGAMLLSCGLIAGGLRLDAVDLKAPFYYDLDALLMLPLVKATVERGFGGHWRNEKMGAPGILDLHDFPVIDHLHFLAIWVLGKFVPNLLVLYNLYFLLTFPLTVLAAMIAFRHLGLTLPAAAVGGLLYSFLPYHYQRWENHYFLAAYWMVPLSLLPAFAVCRGDLPFFRRTPGGGYALHLRSWRTAGLVGLTAAVAAAGAYYAFFTCAVTAFAGVYGWVALRTWRAAASAAGVVALLVGFGLVNHVPTFVYQAEYGKHPITTRYPEEADHYGLKVTHLVLPIEDHYVLPFNRLKWLHNSALRPAETENRSASLGLVGTFGLVGLVAMLLLPLPRPWPYGPLAGMAVFVVLLATIGGFGSVFNLLVTPQIRAYNRISVFVGFFCLFAVVWFVDRLWATHPNGLPVRYLGWFGVGALAAVTGGAALLDLSGFRAAVWGVIGFLWLAPLAAVAYARFRHPGAFDRAAERFRTALLPTRARYPAWAAVFVLGFLDQTPYSWFKSNIVETIEESADRFRADARFFKQIETDLRVGPGARVFCMPYAGFPEAPNVHKMRAYEHARGYIHTDGPVWSYGAMKGRESDVWQREVAAERDDELVRRVVAAGFDGLLVDGRGFPTTSSGNRATALVAEAHRLFAQLAGDPRARLPEVVHADGAQFFLDLRPYRDQFRAKDPADFERRARLEREYLALLWLDGFQPAVNEDGQYSPTVYGTERGSLWVVNPTDRTRTVRVGMTFGTDHPGAFGMKLSGLIEDEFELDNRSDEWDAAQGGVRRQYELTVPPGRHRIRVRCTVPDGFKPTDTRKLCFYVINVHKAE